MIHQASLFELDDSSDGSSLGTLSGLHGDGANERIGGQLNFFDSGERPLSSGGVAVCDENNFTNFDVGTNFLPFRAGLEEREVLLWSSVSRKRRRGTEPGATNVLHTCPFRRKLLAEGSSCRCGIGVDEQE